MSKAIAEKRGTRFCSVACSIQGRKAEREAKRIPAKCEQCGIEYLKGRPAQQYCSRACLGAYRTNRARPDWNPLIGIACRVCGKVFESRKPTRVYCSRACQTSAHKGESKYELQPCETCRKQFKPRRANSRFCSRTCLHDSMRGSKSAAWKGGRQLDSAGYVRIHNPDHPAAPGNGYVKEHRVVMEKILGRYLLPNEEVHHKNGQKDDNRAKNLELWVRSQPRGQRAKDLVDWAREILAKYGEMFPLKE